MAAADPDEADDIAQETFIRAFQRLKDFRSDSSFGTWIHTIAMSVSLNGLRKVKRFRTRESSLDDALTIGVATRRAEPDGEKQGECGDGRHTEHRRHWADQLIHVGGHQAARIEACDARAGERGEGVARPHDPQDGDRERSGGRTERARYQGIALRLRKKPPRGVGSSSQYTRARPPRP